jgi:hypothetical protein
MHVLIAGIYGFLLWLTMLAVVYVHGGPLLKFVLLSPVIISAAMSVLLAIDAMVHGIMWVVFSLSSRPKTD